MLKVKKKAQLTGHNASVFTLAQEDESSNILSAAGDGWLVRWNMEEPEMGKLIAKVETQIFSMCRLRNSDQIVLGNMNGGIHWVQPNDPEATKNIAHHQKGTYAFVEVGQHLFSGGGSGLLTRWDIKTNRSLESLQLSHAAIRCIDFAPERNELAVGCSDHNIYLLDASTLDVKHRIHKAHDNSVFSIRYSPDYTLLLSGGRDAHLKVWNLEQAPKLLSDQPAHWYTINDIVFHPNGHLFATASRDKTIRIWDAQDFRLLKTIETVREQGHVNSVNRLLWSTYNNWLISASDDRRIIVWEIEAS